MLKRFEVQGFKSFLHPVTIDFSDVRDYQFNNTCVKDGLLNKIIVYGRNSVGKTNLGLALFDIVSTLTSNNVSSELYNYYLNADSTTDYAQFDYLFSFDNGEVRYQYRKNAKRELIWEKVLLNSNILYEYDYAVSEGMLEPLRDLMPTLNLNFRGSDSILKYSIANSSLEADHPLYQLLHFVSHMLWFRSLDENKYIGYRSNSSNYLDFIFDDAVLHEFEQFLHQAGIKENLIVRQDTDGEQRLYFDTKVPLPFFKTASSGTRALYTFFYWYKTAADVSLMFIDEFDAFYHYELAETIVKLLENMPQFQTILTSHNTNLLSNRIMRPDCYFILSENGLHSFANATKRELREGHNLEKLYMSGEFNE